MMKFQVSIASINPESTILLLKSLRVITGLSLKDAKDLREFLIAAPMPCILVAGIDRDVADYIVNLLEETGATATVEASSLTVPLLLCPQANRRYQWDWLSGRSPIE
jgi:ribosomal protein L7/L12